VTRFTLTTNQTGLDSDILAYGQAIDTWAYGVNYTAEFMTGNNRGSDKGMMSLKSMNITATNATYPHRHPNLTRLRYRHVRVFNNEVAKRD